MVATSFLQNLACEVNIAVILAITIFLELSFKILVQVVCARVLLGDIIHIATEVSLDGQLILCLAKIWGDSGGDNLYLSRSTTDLWFLGELDVLHQTVCFGVAKVAKRPLKVTKLLEIVAVVLVDSHHDDGEHGQKGVELYEQDKKLEPGDDSEPKVLEDVLAFFNKLFFWLLDSRAIV